MNRRYDHASMDWLYGICHYIIIGIYDAAFRGEVVGLEHIPKTGPFLIAGNHASHLDPPVIGCQIPRQLAFFARKSLWKPGFATWWMDGVGSIPVDRDGSDLGAIKRFLQTLKTGKAIILFPEGAVACAYHQPFINAVIEANFGGGIV